MKHRPALIGAASLAGVVVAGVAAVGANLGILGTANSGGFGELSAANVATTEPRVVDVYVDAAAATQEFAVDAAGTVTLMPDGNGIHLDHVRPNVGWRWTLTRASATELQVDFRSGPDTLAFVAVLNPDGTIAARVDQASSDQTPAPTVAQHEDDDERGDDADDEHEGRDDDD